MKRGEIWWALMKEPQGSEPGFRRPVIIVSSNDFNQSLIQTVTVIIVTSNLRLAGAPGNFKLAKKPSKLSRDSVANVSQVVTLDKSFLTECVSQLDAKHINLLNIGLKLALSL
uniref:mRNA interferase n=1 Tax=uncultured Thiotrichaceae bacterium TaxID=298394 RepID=A0A6S6UM67_9GAMM|nr:MAG: Programmed cell death toxin YdcE [uncultured Thiotrichaceae bacterium]